MLLSGLFLSTLALLPAGVLGALDETAKMANRTIERVSSPLGNSINAVWVAVLEGVGGYGRMYTGTMHR